MIKGLIFAFLFVVVARAQEPVLQLEHLASVGVNDRTFDNSVAEIAAYYAPTHSLFVTNNDAIRIDVFDISSPSEPFHFTSIALSAFGSGLQSLDISEDVLAVAVSATVPQDPGTVVFINLNDLTILKSEQVGSLPDAVKFSPDGRTLVVANEGSPSDDYLNDPEGSISILTIGTGKKFQVSNLEPRRVTVTNLNFHAFEGEAEERNIIYYDIAETNFPTLSQDLEPEFIAISDNSRTAYVVCQENNAIATVNIERGSPPEITDLQGLGFKDNTIIGNGYDSSENGKIEIVTHPTRMSYQPDSLVYMRKNYTNLLVMAAEGDDRDYDAYEELIKVKDLDLDPNTFPDAELLQEDEIMGDLRVSIVDGDTDGDGDIDILTVPGGRSVGIFDIDAGKWVWESGDAIEQLIAVFDPANFNSDADKQPSMDDRSPKKGPEPEGVALGVIMGRTYAFVTLEKQGGVIMLCVEDYSSPTFNDYINTRDFSHEFDDEDYYYNYHEIGDSAPEGIVFVSGQDSASGENLVLVCNEVTGTIAIFQVNCVDHCEQPDRNLGNTNCPGPNGLSN